MNLLDLMNEVGSRVRYGMGPTEKYKLMMSGQVPGQPKPFLPGGADVNPDAERYLSNYLGTQQWGDRPAELFNMIRYMADRNPSVYASGLQGQKAATTGPTLQTLMASLSGLNR